MNPEDYKLIPLDEIADDPALKASYIEMMHRLHQEAWTGDKTTQFVHVDVMSDFADFSRIEHDFETYLDYIHCRGKWTHKSKIPVQIMALTDVENEVVVGEAGFYADEGYDVIDPKWRGKGLGNLILALRLEKAQEMGLKAMIFSVRTDNWRSNRRMEKLFDAGLIEKSWAIKNDRTSMVCHTVPLRPEHTRQTYLKAMLKSYQPYDPPAIEPLPF